MKKNQKTFEVDAGNVWRNCAVFLINMDRSADRLAQFRKNFELIKMPFNRISGFDAGQEDMTSCLIDHDSFKKTHGRKSIRLGEIGCYQSHLRALRAFIVSGKEFGLILEDDVMPQLNISLAVAQLIAWKDDWDIVPLFHFHKGVPVRIRNTTDFKLTVHLTHISSSAAYIVNRRSAEILLQYLTVQRACIDHALFSSWVHGLKLRGIEPMVITLSPQAHISTINSENTDKLAFFDRLPTYVARVYVALRILFKAIADLARFRSGIMRAFHSKIAPD